MLGIFPCSRLAPQCLPVNVGSRWTLNGSLELMLLGSTVSTNWEEAFRCVVLSSPRRRYPAIFPSGTFTRTRRGVAIRHWHPSHVGVLSLTLRFLVPAVRCLFSFHLTRYLSLALRLDVSIEVQLGLSVLRKGVRTIFTAIVTYFAVAIVGAVVGVGSSS